MRIGVIGLALLGLAGCGDSAGPAIVSTKYPPEQGTLNRNSAFQTLNSLPPGAANSGPARAP